MQAGLPIVTFDIGAVREMVEDGVNGFVVPQGDVASLANRIATLIDNKNLLITMGKKGREKFMRKGTFLHFEKRLAAILEDAMTKGLPSTR